MRQINLKLLAGLDSPLKVKSNRDIDFVVIRENTEGEYCGRGVLADRKVRTPDLGGTAATAQVAAAALARI